MKTYRTQMLNIQHKSENIEWKCEIRNIKKAFLQYCDVSPAI